MSHPLWIPCNCGEFICTKHGCHASECECPPIDEIDFDPYEESGMPPKTNAERQKAWRKRRAELVEVRTHVKTEAQRQELLKIAKEMRACDD